ncbi:MAG: 1-deoxy-D-xylulose-5-phosphate reductoisomerase [Candidatus Handelsmanbacteria bacterium RIFCSPLOWO2_12_FULL_64_10]|uniref:1-deoxy-D-xylulose 5-phosphate reductoisomerase n=1 Tax=Handelsmanbacteria sp. (strain RIFCSPLOWO2_12_FULL_64_10) TaxID=1817868 RepID=A0A1F6D3G0_HANXR|nr:MAG: 1-deoxy-D-xylulose-5-phosphate reductoisomerase [Candidatus Handelsmanbacteria bacterium RIFCSPLOWO2_12_FULL_64_10]
MKRIVILGSTGSIGQNSLDVIEGLQDRFQVVGLSAGRNVELLCEQAIRHRPSVVCVGDERGADAARRRLTPFGIQVIAGPGGLTGLSAHPDADLVLNALVGSVGLQPTLSAIRAGKAVAMANKEPLVMAGGILVREARLRGVDLLPLDSEPSALWQCLKGERIHEVRRLILTASGGPFFGWSLDRLRDISPEQALNHPTWRMGRKITIDSATLMNKGLEVIEARWLFDLPASRIDVVVHRQSIVHSLVEFVDGSVMAQMSCPDMRLPIQHALTYPERLPTRVEPLNLLRLSQFTFEPPDTEQFPCLWLCYEAARLEGTAPAVLNAANEIAVSQFLNGQIGFLDIAAVNEEVLSAHRVAPEPDIEEVLEADRWARREAARVIRRKNGRTAVKV